MSSICSVTSICTFASQSKNGPFSAKHSHSGHKKTVPGQFRRQSTKFLPFRRPPKDLTGTNSVDPTPNIHTLRKETIPIRSDIYELIALIARYWFALVIVLFVIRAWRITIVDNRRAKVLRSFAASTGQLGEMVVTRGSGRVRRGMRFPVLQEGMIGSSARADIRLRNSGVKKRHAHFRLRPDGLLLTGIGDAPLAFSDGNSGRKLLATDGDTLVFGDIHLLVVLFDGQTDQVHERVAAPDVTEHYDEYDFSDSPAYDYDGSNDPFMLNQEDPWQKPIRKRKNSKRR